MSVQSPVRLDRYNEPEPDFALLRGVPEVWIVDLDDLAIDVHRGPADEGYAPCSSEAQGRVLEPSLLPGVRIAVSDVFGPLL